MSRNLRMYPKYETELFCDVYDEASEFLADYKASGIYSANTANRMTDNGVNALFYLLYAQYANSPIANYDINQFKYKVFTTMFKYGPAWEKRLDIQDKLRALTEADIRDGSSAINAHAFAMGDDSVAADTDPTKIDQKSSTKYTRSKIDGYAQLWDILKADVTNEFIGKFKSCFKQFVMPEHPTIYETELIDDEED